jgi:hypothetical protein
MFPVKQRISKISLDRIAHIRYYYWYQRHGCPLTTAMKPRPGAKESRMAISIHTTGEYYSINGTVKQIKPFKEVVRAPSLEFFRQTNERYMGTDDNGKLKFKTNSFINVRGVLKKRLMPQILVRKYPDFVRIRKVTIHEIVSDDGSALELPLQLMSRPQIASYIKTRQIPLDAAEYMDIDELRSDVDLYQQNPDVFLAGQEKRRTKRAEEREFMELNNLNDLKVETKKKTAAIE